MKARPAQPVPQCQWPIAQCPHYMLITLQRSSASAWQSPLHFLHAWQDSLLSLMRPRARPPLPTTDMCRSCQRSHSISFLWTTSSQPMSPTWSCSCRRGL